MAQSMIERVTVSLENAPYTASTPCILPDLSHGQAMALARAAIEAMREPTEAMVKTGTDLHTHQSACATDYGFAADESQIIEVFRAMIDAALCERGGK